MRGPGLRRTAVALRRARDKTGLRSAGHCGPRGHGGADAAPIRWRLGRLCLPYEGAPHQNRL